MLAIVENAGGDVEKAAVAEQRVIDAMRELGQDVLQQWAHRQQDAQATACQATPGVNRKKKTLYWLALRVLRANHEWDAYWTRFNQQAA